MKKVKPEILKAENDKLRKQVSLLSNELSKLRELSFSQEYSKMQNPSGENPGLPLNPQAMDIQYTSRDKMYREILEDLPIPYLEIDLNQRIKYLNKAATITSGYDGEDVKNGLYLSRLFPYPEKLDENFRKAMQGNRKDLLLYEFFRKDGSTASVLVMSIPELNENKVAGVATIVLDINENLQIANSLRHSEEKFRQFAQLLPQTIFEIDVEGNFLFLNDYSYVMFGYEKTDKIGNAFSRIIPNDQPRLRKNLEKIIKGEKTTGNEYTGICKDGTTLPILIYSSIVYENGRLIGFRGMILDITERKIIEKELFESQEKYRTLTNQLPLGIYRTSVDGKILYANPALARILGYPSVEELMKVQAREVYVNPAIRSSLLKSLKKNQAPRTKEFSFKRKDGSLIWIRDTFRNHVNEKGKMDYFDGIIEDITETVLLKGKLEQSRKLQAIGTLAGGIAHDFNNLLMGMQLFTDLAMNSIPSRSQAAGNLAKVISAQNKAKNLVEQILSFSQKPKRKKIKIELKSTIEGIIAQIASTLPKGITMKTQILECGSMLADPMQLERILMNLCNNAVQAMEKYGILEIQMEQVSLKDPILQIGPAGRRKHWIKLSVKDNGKGMDKQTRERIFDPFFTTRRVGTGVGLGMTIVHNLVEQYRGMIFVDSAPRKGTTITVYLPALLNK